MRISLTVRSLERFEIYSTCFVICQLCWIFFIAESVLWIRKFRLKDSCFLKFFDTTTFLWNKAKWWRKTFPLAVCWRRHCRTDKMSPRQGKDNLNCMCSFCTIKSRFASRLFRQLWQFTRKLYTHNFTPWMSAAFSNKLN